MQGEFHRTASKKKLCKGPGKVASSILHEPSHILTSAHLHGFPVLSVPSQWLLFWTHRLCSEEWTSRNQGTGPLPSESSPPYSYVNKTEKDIDGFQMPIKYPTSGGQMRSQEAADVSP